MAGPQPQSTQWTLPPTHRRRVVYTFIGVPNGGTGMLTGAGHGPRQSMPVGRPAQASTDI